MKIMYIITELTPAGAERMLADLAGSMVERGHTVEVVSLLASPRETDVVRHLAASNVAVHFLDARKTAVLSVLRSLRRAVRAFRPDLVHAHLIHPNLLSRIALAGTGIPLVNTIHIAERRRGKGLFFLLDRLTMRRCNTMTAVSRAAAAYHAERCGIPADRIRVIYNGVDPVTPAPSEFCAQFLAECGLADCDKIIGCVGRLDWQKGFDRLLRAMPELAKRVPHGKSWGILFLGEGAQRIQLEQLAKDFYADGIQIAFPGYRADATALMNSFDAFVMPSRYEGYGLVLAEAMSLGLPCVLSDADSLPELVRDYPGYTREIHFTDTPSDDADFAAAIGDAIRASRSTPYLHCEKQRMLSDYLSLYESLTERT